VEAAARASPDPLPAIANIDVIRTAAITAAPHSRRPSTDLTRKNPSPEIARPMLSTCLLPRHRASL
jgi:hypothetical protein